MKRIFSVTGTGAAVVSGVALGHSHWPLILGIGTFVLVGAALIIVAWAAFSSRSAPMTRLRALVRDLRGDQRSALKRAYQARESGPDASRPSLRGHGSPPCGRSIYGYRADATARRRR